MEAVDLEVLNKHLFVGEDGSGVFVFEPENAFMPNPDGEGVVLKPDVTILDFLAVMDGLDLERTEFNARSLATVLLERREEGDEELMRFA